jgi:hypothetical protein
VVDVRGGKLEGLEVPPGDYQVGLTGTGSGAAHLVFDLPNAHGDRAWTLALASRRGANGTVTLGQGGPGAARFGGRRYRASRGLGLVVHGLPASLRRGRLNKLSLRVADAFGATAPGLLVVATGPHGFHASAVTDAHGRILLRIPKTFTGTLRLVFGGPAYAKLIRTLRLR